MSRQPPTTTLFPYTTLFRSPNRRTLFPGRLAHDKKLHSQSRLAPQPLWHLSRAVSPRLQLRDRKSTRLNSSHVAISYAVFCLKKKFQTSFASSSTLSTRPTS